jgi:hypothetical protein
VLYDYAIASGFVPHMAAFGRNQMGTLIVFQSSCINAKNPRIENLSDLFGQSFDHQGPLD